MMHHRARNAQDHLMMPPTPEWEERLAALWKKLDTLDEIGFVEQMRGLVGELPPKHPVALFELGGAHDSVGLPKEAVSLYQAALDAGLFGSRRRQARIQMASSLRNLGEAQRAADILLAEHAAPGDELDQAVSAFLALALVDLGREREAVALSLQALATYLPRYNVSLARYADALLDARSS